VTAVVPTRTLNARLGKLGWYDLDKRRRRRQHRRAAKQLRELGGGTCESVARWHLANARYLGR
jgi:hypothetical protein